MVKEWLHRVEQGYTYTAGPVGTRFLGALREGKIAGGRCSLCGRTHVPPRSYCQHDFGEVRELVELGEAYLEAYTVIHMDHDGRSLGKPVVLGLVRFPNTVGGIIHYINADPERLVVGSRLRPVFKDPKERRGSVTDILYFEPA
jgi:hypothetical protein